MPCKGLFYMGTLVLNPSLNVRIEEISQNNPHIKEKKNSPILEGGGGTFTEGQRNHFQSFSRS